jgi:hypothetical protein
VPQLGHHDCIGPGFRTATPTPPPDDLESGILAPGDAIALLWDIEQAFPELTALDETP